MTTRHIATCLLAGAFALAAAAAHAQMYRSVGPDGKVTYTDQPPPAASASNRPAGASGSPSGASGALPYQLGQTAQRYPVTLYTSSECSGCNAGRNLLINRGIPFTEKTVEATQEDITALQSISGGNELPVLTIGAQRLKGYSDQEWTQYLDAAGYPKTSELPSSYRRPAPTPLVAAKAITAPPDRSERRSALPEQTAPTEPSIAPPRTADNPAGIRF